MLYQSFARARRFGRQLVGPALGVYLAGLTAAAVLALLLLLAPILIELLATGGAVAVPIEHSSAIDALGVRSHAADGTTAHYAGRGLLPTVWRLRHSWLGPTIRGLYAAWPALRSNAPCLALLVGCEWLLAIAAAATLYWLESAVQSAAIETTGALRRQIHAQALRLGASDLFLGQKTTSSALFVEQADAVRRGLVDWWRALPHAVVFALLLLGLAMSADFWLVLATVLLAALTGRLFYKLRQRERRREVVEADRATKLGTLLLEHLQQNRVMGILRLEDRVDSEMFDENLRRFNAALLGRDAAAAALGPFATLLVLGGAGLVLLLAGFSVLRDPPRRTLADVVLLGSTLAAAVYPLVRFQRVLKQLPAADEAAHDVFAYLDREPKVGQVPEATPLERLRRDIALEHVSLSDAVGKRILEDVSLSLPAEGQTVLFSSEEAAPLAVAGLLARYCDPSSGRVVLDGRDLRQATLDSVRRQVMVILPDSVLVSGTLAENIVGNDRNMRAVDIIEALKLVHAYEIVQPLPEGLETVVGPHGLALSAGQAIRLALTRVALRQPSVVVIEEPREELDQMTAERVADALDRATQRRALVILARRLATLRAARRILLFHEGRLVADGTHQELLQQNELYRHLNYVRFNEFRGKVKW